MKNILSIDCDNILCDTARAFLKYYKFKYGKEVSYDAIRHAYLHENEEFSEFDRGREAYYDFFVWAHDTGVLKPMKGSQEGITFLKDAGYELHVVTGRLSKQLDFTQRRLDAYFPNTFDDIHLGSDMTDEHITKGVLCKNINAKLHIDDFIHYAQEITVEDIPVIILDCPRNNHQSIDSSLITRVLDRSIITPDFVHNIVNAA